MNYEDIKPIDWGVVVDPAQWSVAAHSRLLDDLIVPRMVEVWPTPRGDDTWYRKFMTSESLRKMFETRLNIVGVPYVGELGYVDCGFQMVLGARDKQLLDFIDKLSYPPPMNHATRMEYGRWFIMKGRQCGTSTLLPHYAAILDGMNRPRTRSTPPAKRTRLLTAILSTMEDLCRK